MRRDNVDFCMAQLLFGNGCFDAYLHRLQILDREDCSDCRVPDFSENTFFDYPIWKETRDRGEAIIKPLNATNAVEVMAKGEVGLTTVPKQVRLISLYIFICK